MNQIQLNESIYEMARSEMKDLTKLVKKAGKTDDGIEALEGYREPLSMDTSIEVKILLSWGGPSDGYKLKFDKEQELISGVYWFADWGTYAESELNDEEMGAVYQAYLYGDASSFFEQ
jgi:hypothetical protein